MLISRCRFLFEVRVDENKLRLSKDLRSKHRRCKRLSLGGSPKHSGSVQALRPGSPSSILAIPKFEKCDVAEI